MRVMIMMVVMVVWFWYDDNADVGNSVDDEDDAADYDDGNGGMVLVCW